MKRHVCTSVSQLRTWFVLSSLASQQQASSGDATMVRVVRSRIGGGARRRGTNREEAYYWRIGRGGGLHERARVGQDWIQVKKIIDFEQKHLPTRSFYESSLPPIFFFGSGGPILVRKMFNYFRFLQYRLSYHLANKRSIHVRSQGLEILTLIKKNRKIKITHHCHYDKNQPKVPLCLIKNHPPIPL